MSKKSRDQRAHRRKYRVTQPEDSELLMKKQIKHKPRKDSLEYLNQWQKHVDDRMLEWRFQKVK